MPSGAPAEATPKPDMGAWNLRRGKRNHSINTGFPALDSHISPRITLDCCQTPVIVYKVCRQRPARARVLALVVQSINMYELTRRDQPRDMFVWQHVDLRGRRHASEDQAWTLRLPILRRVIEVRPLPPVTDATVSTHYCAPHIV